MNMKLLIFSDSHSALHFMRQCVELLRPDGIVHLGDYYDDGQAIHEEYTEPAFYQVAGNCDSYRAPMEAKKWLCIPVSGVMIFMAHGHTHHVKSGIDGLVADARRHGAKAVLYGHTHIPDCHREEDGLWVVNPGSCGYGGGSAAVMELADGQVASCKVITAADLDI